MYRQGQKTVRVIIIVVSVVPAIISPHIAKLLHIHVQIIHRCRCPTVTLTQSHLYTSLFLFHQINTLLTVDNQCEL